MVSAAGLTKIDTRKAPWESAIRRVEPVTQKRDSCAVIFISVDHQRSVHKHRGIGVKIYLCAGGDRQLRLSVHAESAEDHIRQLRVPHRRTGQYGVAEKMGVLSIGLQLDKLLVPVKGYLD